MTPLQEFLPPEEPKPRASRFLSPAHDGTKSRVAGKPVHCRRRGVRNKQGNAEDGGASRHALRNVHLVETHAQEPRRREESDRRDDELDDHLRCAAWAASTSATHAVSFFA